jgi:hypothetical protein
MLFVTKLIRAQEEFVSVSTFRQKFVSTVERAKVGVVYDDIFLM